MHEALEKQMKYKEEDLFCTKERIKELEKNKCAIEKNCKDSESMNKIL